MSDPIKAGMYRGENKVKQVSLDPRFVKVRMDDGTYVDVPSVEYVRDLERQILELRKAVGIVEGASNRHDNLFRRLGAGIRKVDSKLR